MSTQATIRVHASFLTFIWHWVTKMVTQWVCICIPFIVCVAYVCPDVALLLAGRLLLYSVTLATLFSAMVLLGEVRADRDGIKYRIFGKDRKSISWKELEFRKPSPYSFEKPFVVAKKNSNEQIKIWPSMSGFAELKALFADHDILLEKSSAIPRQKLEFRSFDEVLGEAASSKH